MAETLKQYKARVREKAIEVAREQEWCISGLNEALAELGLEPVNNKIKVVLVLENKDGLDLDNHWDIAKIIYNEDRASLEEAIESVTEA